MHASASPAREKFGDAVIWVVDQLAQSFGGLPRHWRRSPELGWKQKEKRVM
ncbi:hypothetical protein C2845_PM16G21380 [Panicum miliaceum]|uniref:Uncharacterized protein n=1 Tax=Panicum miliaceum TaxID=4540 RepID=A0A3L6PX61_PANMI|nr:hypothetical protein C2845_PM16G21380 [Panicum miliaceum]